MNEGERPADQGIDPKFYSTVVHSSGAAAIEMTGERDVAQQDWELRVIFGTRPGQPGDEEFTDHYAGQDQPVVTD